MCKNEKLMIVSMCVVLMGWLVPAAMAQGPVSDGLVFWLDASKPGDLTLSGSNVSRWNDRSGNNYYAEQTAAAQRSWTLVIQPAIPSTCAGCSLGMPPALP